MIFFKLLRILNLKILVSGSLLLLCLVSASPSPSPSSPSLNPHSSKLCTSPACLEAGRRMAASLNTSAEPCEDFYAYACGGWLKANPIPGETSGITVTETVRDGTMMALKTIFEQEIKALSATSSPSAAAAPQAKSVRLVLDLYRECTDLAARDRLGLGPLRKLLHDTLGADWPAVDETSLNKSRLDLQNHQDGLLQTIAQATTLLSSAPLISFFIDKDLIIGEKGKATKMIEFIAPTFGLTAKIFADSTGAYHSEVDVYRRQIKKLAKLLFFSSRSSSNNSKNLESALDTRAEEVFTFERTLALAQLIKSDSDARNASFSYHRMTLKKLSKRTSTPKASLDYTAYLNQLATLHRLPFRFNVSDRVLVSAFSYYRQLATTLSGTPPLVLHNYLGYKLAWQWKDATGSQGRFLKLWRRNRQWGITRMRPLWKDCLDEITGAMGGGWAASRLYVDHIVAPEVKKQAAELVEDLRKVFAEQILFRESNQNGTSSSSSAARLDETTQKKALEKVARTQFIVAYPDWLLNATALDLIKYGLGRGDSLKVKRDHFFDSAVEEVRRQKAAEMRKLHQADDVLESFPAFKPIKVGASASLEHNAVAISAALLQPPFFEPTVPAALNYGAVGAIIGHEITHHFDDEGAQYDASGSLLNWWSPETRARFQTKSGCFVSQYEAIVDRLTGASLKGTRTLGENISDNGGVRVAYLAMEARLKKDQLGKGEGQKQVPLLEHFSAQQLFFLSYAQMNCGHSRPKVHKVILDRGRHLPDEHRVNVPLRNLEHFSAAFNCPRGSAMNPIHKCRLW